MARRDIITVMRNAEGKLPVVTDQAAESCGCDRRTVLGGLAIGALVAGCRIDDPGAGADDDVPTDGPAGDAAPGDGFEVDGNTVRVDLAHPNNLSLATAGGARVIAAGTKKVMIARTTATEFATMSAVCTHAGCTVKFALAASQMQCPCHQSKFDLTGAVVSGPATRDLTQFTNVFDEPGNLLTITLV